MKRFVGSLLVPMATLALTALAALALASLLHRDTGRLGVTLHTQEAFPPPITMQQAALELYDGLEVRVTDSVYNSRPGVTPPTQVVPLAAALARRVFGVSFSGLVLLNCAAHVTGEETLYWRVCGQAENGDSLDLLLDAGQCTPVYGQLSPAGQGTLSVLLEVNRRSTDTVFRPTPPAGFSGTYLAEGLHPVRGSGWYSYDAARSQIAYDASTPEAEVGILSWAVAAGLVARAEVTDVYAVWQEETYGPFETGGDATEPVPYGQTELALAGGRYLTVLWHDDRKPYSFSFSSASVLEWYLAEQEW